MSTKDHKLNKFSVELMILCVHRLPDYGTPVVKHVRVGTYHELCLMVSSLLYLLSMFVDYYIEYKKMHHMNNIEEQ